MRTLTQDMPWNAVVNNAASKARHIIGLFTPNLTIEVLVVDSRPISISPLCDLNTIGLHTHVE